MQKLGLGRKRDKPKYRLMWKSPREIYCSARSQFIKVKRIQAFTKYLHIFTCVAGSRCHVPYNQHSITHLHPHTKSFCDELLQEPKIMHQCQARLFYKNQRVQQHNPKKILNIRASSMILLYILLYNLLIFSSPLIKIFAFVNLIYLEINHF